MTSQAPPPLPDIDDVPPLSEADDECIKEVRDVLERHGAISRFGLMLLHDHFPIAEDETLLETVDVENRTLMLRPAKREQLAEANTVQTSWRLDSPTAMTDCKTQCVKAGERHGTTHITVKT